jgi:ribonucleoside-diphosphate reductase alpha chain
MLVNRDEIVFDAELKRAALARGPLPVGDPAALVGDAVATLADAGREPVHTVDVTVHSAAGVEAALIAGGHFEVAKALVLRRTVLLPDGPPVLGSPKLIRRSGHVVRWNATKIEAAIRKAFLSLGADPSPAEAVADRVDERAHALGIAYVPIEVVQDLVQEELVLGGHMRAAERYILYRAERAALRACGTAEELRARIEFASIGLELDASPDELERELCRALRPGEDERRLVVLNAKSLAEHDSEYMRWPPRSIRRPTWTSTSSGSRRSTTAT